MMKKMKKKSKLPKHRNRIYSYNAVSKGAKSLAKASRLLRINHKTPGYYARDERDVVVNWGSTVLPDRLLTGSIINDPRLVDTACDKWEFFLKMHAAGICVPPFTNRKDEAIQWVKDGEVVFARTLLRANGGRGIVICEKELDIPDAMCYTMYVKKAAEYRVHVVDNQVIDIQRKIKDPKLPEPEDWRIRNHDNGFIFVRSTGDNQPLNPNRLVIERSIAAIQILNLDFGAVDVIWNEKKGEAYVLEVNTAPGLEGETTLNAYANAIKNLITKRNQEFDNKNEVPNLRRYTGS